MGLLFSLFCIFGLIIVAIETRKRRKKKDVAFDGYIDSGSHSGMAKMGWPATPMVAKGVALSPLFFYFIFLF
jgi:protein brassinosteroid insensitive 1